MKKTIGIIFDIIQVHDSLTIIRQHGNKKNSF